MNITNFTPHETYEGLKIQARALYRMVFANNDRTKAALSRQEQEFLKVVKDYQEKIKSEKVMNFILTEELEEAEKTIQDLRSRLGEARR